MKNKIGCDRGFVIYLSLIIVIMSVFLFTGPEKVWEHYMLYILFMLVSMYLNVIIHELGHLVFGFITGYSFVSFRVSSHMLKKDANEKYIFKKIKVPGTGGQCLMMPPGKPNEKYPFVLYNAGGAILNFFVSGIAFILFKAVLPHSIVAALFFSAFSAISLFMALGNIIPLKISGSPNDGYNIYSLYRDETAREAFWHILAANKELTDGKRYGDMPVEWFTVNRNEGLENIVVLGRALNAVNRYIDIHDFDRARETMAWLMNNLPKMSEPYRNTLILYMLFIELVKERRPHEIERLYKNKNIGIIIDSAVQPQVLRLSYAYEKLYRKDNEKAGKTINKFNKIIEKYPYPGEIASELELITLIDSLYR